jgi:hypothetical protein
MVIWLMRESQKVRKHYVHLDVGEDNIKMDLKSILLCFIHAILITLVKQHDPTVKGS